MIKLNGTNLECTCKTQGKLLNIMLPLDECPIQLFRADKCEVEHNGEIFKCTVAESYVKSRYGQPKLRVMLLRIDRRFKKAIEKKPIQKVIKPSVTKTIKEDSDKLLKKHKDVLDGLAKSKKPKAKKKDK